jgi:hypothetical protein
MFSALEEQTRACEGPARGVDSISLRRESLFDSSFKRLLINACLDIKSRLLMTLLEVKVEQLIPQALQCGSALQSLMRQFGTSGLQLEAPILLEQVLHSFLGQSGCLVVDVGPSRVGGTVKAIPMLLLDKHLVMASGARLCTTLVDLQP